MWRQPLLGRRLLHSDAWRAHQPSRGPLPHFSPLINTHVHTHTQYHPAQTHQTCLRVCVTCKVDYYREYFFNQPQSASSFGSPVIIAVTPDLSPDNDANLGNLKAISPEEPRHALIFAIARDIDKGMTDAELEPWKTISLSAVVHFKKVDHEDEIFWQATNCREAVGAQFEVVYYSSVLAPAFKCLRCFVLLSDAYCHTHDVTLHWCMLDTHLGAADLSAQRL